MANFQNQSPNTYATFLKIYIYKYDAASPRTFFKGCFFTASLLLADRRHISQ